jgi:hypothetical protein
MPKARPAPYRISLPLAGRVASCRKHASGMGAGWGDSRPSTVGIPPTPNPSQQEGGGNRLNVVARCCLPGISRERNIQDPVAKIGKGTAFTTMAPGARPSRSAGMTRPARSGCADTTVVDQICGAGVMRTARRKTTICNGRGPQKIKAPAGRSPETRTGGHVPTSHERRCRSRYAYATNTHFRALRR